MSARRVKLFLLGLALLGASACVTAAPKADVFWPPKPEVTRVRFVTSFSSTEDLDRSSSARFWRTVLGGSRDVRVGLPMGLATSTDGQRLYIADYGLQALLVADLAAKTLTQVANFEVVGKPFAVAVDSKENLYVTDQVGKRVVVLNAKGELLRAFGKNAGLERPCGLALDARRGLLYVSDPATLQSPNHRVVVFDLEGNLVRVVGTKGTGDGELFFPMFVALDPEGNLYVADTMNFRVQVFDPEGRFVRKYGEHGDGPGTFARLKGLAVDKLGILYVVDGDHATVQLFTRTFQELMYFGGYAQTLEYFGLPSGIAVNPASNRIYVADEINPRINVYELVNTTAEDLPR